MSLAIKSYGQNIWTIWHVGSRDSELLKKKALKMGHNVYTDAIFQPMDPRFPKIKSNRATLSIQYAGAMHALQQTRCRKLFDMIH